MRGEKYDNQIKKSGYRVNKLDMAIEKVSEREDGLEENSQNINHKKISYYVFFLPWVQISLVYSRFVTLSFF